jgi:hypothetical protein
MSRWCNQRNPAQATRLHTSLPGRAREADDLPFVPANLIVPFSRPTGSPRLVGRHPSFLGFRFASPQANLFRASGSGRRDSGEEQRVKISDLLANLQPLMN